MARKVLVPILAALALGAAGAAAAQAVPAHVTAALADAARPEADKARDAARKPGEILALAEVKPGAKVADFIMGGGYFTRVLARAVGPNGKVWAYQPAEFIQFQASYGENLKTASGAYDNVEPLSASLGALDLPDGLDAVITVQNYHDLHLQPFPTDTAAKVNAAAFAALKPGGRYVIIDHDAAAGSGLSAAHTLHRIDIEAVKQEVQAAGFVLDGESGVLANPEDPRTANVFNPAIRGRTSQFMLRFRKPG